MSHFDGTQSTSVAELKRPLVLVVDDDEGIRDALREILEDAGFATVDARDGLEALKLLGRLTSAPTFILLDLTMPVMDGWAFCESRGRSRTLSEIPVIAISADDLSEGERPVGIDAFLSKPIDVDKFARLAIRMAALCSLRARRNKRLH